MSFPFTCSVLFMNWLVFNLPSPAASLSKAYYFPSIRVLTFNVWNSGRNVENGMEKIVKHIKLIDPDLIAFQEIETEQHFADIIRLLGPNWTGFFHRSNYIDTAIATKHKIFRETVAQSEVAVGGKINVPIYARGFAASINISLWSIHADHHSYGPYAACNKLVTQKWQIMAGEREASKKNTARVQEILELLANPSFQQALERSAKEPLILAGDFNSPSHLDWPHKSRRVHCDWWFEWPMTKTLMSRTGLSDSYRDIYPDPVSHPGITWSTVQKFTDSGWGWTVPEPQDRIDMIFYRGQRLRPIYSLTYQGTQFVQRKPNEFKNDFPSDHLAVITDFQIVRN